MKVEEVFQSMNRHFGEMTPEELNRVHDILDTEMNSRVYKHIKENINFDPKNMINLSGLPQADFDKIINDLRQVFGIPKEILDPENKDEEFLKNVAKAHASDSVNHPPHYGGDTTYEHIKVSNAWGLSYELGNATKYICRAGKKNTALRIEDLKKAIWYIEAEIKRIVRDGNTRA